MLKQLSKIQILFDSQGNVMDIVIDEELNIIDVLVASNELQNRVLKQLSDNLKKQVKAKKGQ